VRALDLWDDDNPPLSSSLAAAHDLADEHTSSQRALSRVQEERKRRCDCRVSDTGSGRRETMARRRRERRARGRSGGSTRAKGGTEEVWTCRRTLSARAGREERVRERARTRI